MDTRRRTFLASAAAAGTLLAGCLGGERDGDAASEPTGSAEPSNPDADTSAVNTAEGTRSETARSTADGTPEGSTTDRPRSGGASAVALDHPAAADLGAEPILGAANAPAAMIAFEDPSCHDCARFNTRTVPEIEAKLIDTGRVRFVYRNFPYLDPWGELAMGALEATFARSAAAHWALKTHYYETQDAFDDSNVFERTRAFLAGLDDDTLDPAAIVRDAEQGAFEDAVERDVAAGEDAGVVSTPTFYCFREGRFLTEIRGPQSYSVFENALGV